MSSKSHHSKSYNYEKGNKYGQKQKKSVENCKKTVPRPLKPYVFLWKTYVWSIEGLL